MVQEFTVTLLLVWHPFISPPEPMKVCQDVELKEDGLMKGCQTSKRVTVNSCTIVSAQSDLAVFRIHV